MLKKISIKHIFWLLTIFVLFFGWQYRHKASWVMLLTFLVIDIISTTLINRSFAKGDPLGDPNKDLKKLAKDSAEDFYKEKAFGLVLPEEVSEAYLAAKSSEQEIRENYKFSLAWRASINVLWTIFLFFFFVYCFLKWW